MSEGDKIPIQITNFAVSKIKSFIKKQSKNSDLKLRVYIISGGCGGFRYGFSLDDQVSVNDCVIEKNGAGLIVDALSLQYLSGGIVDYHEGLDGSKFIVTNPNAKTTCSCGYSFSV